MIAIVIIFLLPLLSTSSSSWYVGDNFCKILFLLVYVAAVKDPTITGCGAASSGHPEDNAENVHRACFNN